jgi:hypothetical protein
MFITCTSYASLASYHSGHKTKAKSGAPLYQCGRGTYHFSGTIIDDRIRIMLSSLTVAKEGADEKEPMLSGIRTPGGHVGQ